MKAIWYLILVYNLRTVSYHNKKLLHDIFHIGPGMNPRLQYQARQRSWRSDIGRELIPGTKWKISCHNFLITYYTLTFYKHCMTFILQKISMN
jgi:hypothetical protein